MGCDIHLYIEHKGSDWSGWCGLGGSINPGRDYHMFAKMAGVRNYNKDKEVLFEPRGLPEDVSHKPKSDNRLYIINEGETGGNEYATRNDAERWVAQGISKYVDKHWVTHPDWHSHSWLTADEFEKCIESLEDVGSEYKAILSALRCFESLGEQTRIVFYFDN